MSEETNTEKPKVKRKRKNHIVPVANVPVPEIKPVDIETLEKFVAVDVVKAEEVVEDVGVAIVSPLATIILDDFQSADPVLDEEVLVTSEPKTVGCNPRKKFIDAVHKYCDNVYLNSGRVDFFLKVIKGGGTVAITQHNKLVHLNKLSPDNGGRKVLGKNRILKVVLNDVL